MSETKERPILFSSAMIRAILDGRKTQTRRIIPAKHFQAPPAYVGGQFADGSIGFVSRPSGRSVTCPYGKPDGDILWVRETWGNTGAGGDRYVYRATPPDWFEEADHLYDGWKPSIHMPRVACRLRLRITDVRVERLNSVSEEDAIAEGVEAWRESWDTKTAATMLLRSGAGMLGDSGETTGRRLFRALWDSINGGKAGCDWASDPFVWCLTFEKEPTPDAAI